MSARPGESVEGITVPQGDPAALLTAGRQLEAVGVDLGQQANQIDRAPSLMGSWAGPGSSMFADLTGAQANTLHAASFSVLNAGLQIASSADLLEDAQKRAQKAIVRAQKARDEINDAKDAIRQALDDEKDAQGRMDAAVIARQTAEMKLFSSALDSLLGDGGAQAAVDAANAAYAAAEKDLHEAERREKRARTKLKHAEDDLRDARKDGQDAADDAESNGLVLQMVLRTMPAGVLGAPGLPSEASIGAAGNVPKPQPQNIPISEMQPPKHWPGWAKALYKVGRGETAAVAGTVSLAKKAYDNPEKIPGGFANLGSNIYHHPVGTAKALVDYDDLANGRPFDWVGGMGIGFLSGGAGTVPARGSRLLRVVGSPKIEKIGRTPFPLYSKKFAGTKMDFKKPDFGARPGTGVPDISESQRLKLAARYPNGVRFTRAGYPVFTPEAIKRVHVDNLSGNYTTDANMANKAIGETSTPKGYTWHHVEDGKTMELVPRDLHRAASHTGGAAAIRNDQTGLVRPGGVFTPFERGGAIGGGAAGFALGGPAPAGGQ
jgi:hypothetical protein